MLLLEMSNSVFFAWPVVTIDSESNPLGQRLF